MEILLQNEVFMAVIVQMPFVGVMGIIMLGMRQDLQDLRQDLKDCINVQQEMLKELIAKD